MLPKVPCAEHRPFGIGVRRRRVDAPAKAADAIVEENANARIDGLRTSLSLLAVVALIALFVSRRISTQQLVRSGH
jgi:hypothetical protein